jgi:hypothetical protein
MEINQQILQEKWAPVLDSKEAGAITDQHRRRVTAVVLENQERAFAEERGQALTETAANAGHAPAGSNVDGWDPVLISLVRRATPNLLAFDLVGVQPMTGPTGLIFAMKSRYTSQTGTEALFNEADTGFSGAASGDLGTADAGNNDPFSGDDPTSGPSADAADSDTVAEYQPGSGNTTATAEAQGNTGPAIPQMAFSIDKTTVTAKSRALKAEYTTELAQDLKAVHGLSAETELANILSSEILAEMNREIIRLVNINGKTSSRGAVAGTWNATNAADNGGARWSIERFKALVQNIEHEANQIAVATRRGKGNWCIMSHGVAAALNAAGVMDTGMGALGAQQMDSDVTGSLFVGVLNGSMKCYVDPYAGVDYFNVGYKGTNPYDAGMFYCPYVPLSMMKTIGENDFQPKIGFKTRYGVADNPFVTAGNNANVYYRKRKVTNL